MRSRACAACLLACQRAEPSGRARVTQLEDADDVLEELEEALIVSGAPRALARRPPPQEH